MKELNETRKEIDAVDQELVKLYLKRLDLCGEVAEVKKNSGKKVFDSARENEILYRVTEDVPEKFRLYVKELYTAIFGASKAYQTSIIGRTSPTVERIEEIIKTGLPALPNRAAVACQGVKGANSGTACNKLFPICDITYFKTFDGVFSAVDKGLCEYGILPIENSTAGSVNEVYDLMKKYNFHIVRSVRLPIEHCLAGVPGAKKEGVKKVLSHPQALNQCAEYLKKMKVETESAENTATAAKTVSETDDKTIAVLCSPECAELYGLTVLDRSVQDADKNYTRFICIGKELQIFSGSDKISIMTALSHKPGSLNSILMKFSSLGLNLTKIESRPIMGTDFEFMFYFDFEGDITGEDTLQLIAELESNSDKFVFLGSYKEVI